MKLLKDYPKVHSLLASTVYEDILIGIEFLKRLNLTDTELLEMMPSRMVGDSDRDFYMKAVLPDDPTIIPITKKVSIYMNRSWIFCIKDEKTKEAYT